MHDLNEHATKCEGPVVLTGEVREGLASIMSSRCSTCSHTITLEMADKMKGPRGYSRWECNLAAVWGHMATAGGHSQLKETECFRCPRYDKGCLHSVREEHL